MTSTRPMIGVTGYYVSADEGYGGKLRGNIGQAFSLIGEDYLRSVERAGGIPIGIPLMDDDSLFPLLSRLDGIVVTGGEDVDPKQYGETVDHRVGRLSLERDEFELRLIAAALAARKPILAICRGMQMLNVYFGGSLHKDVSDLGATTLTHNFEKIPRWYTAHTVRLTQSLLQSLYGDNEIEVNSYHHQSVKDVGRGLVVAAQAPDGVIEALVHAEFDNLLAVQWHPEMMAVRNDAGLVPFRWLIGAAQTETESQTDSTHAAPMGFGSPLR
ncbi:gamma-glutamyl-gamma-aminobutyrate hydrolase family protein [Alicyclobacillus sp. ALC3]|uniref:gamma-glutamyl-gamma-aminobutyrate hydrolase family protein n=1 Tax=Alicyclobacillus sp. ALC3 TaxID=2796143 RepID=UPI0023783E66|nr:gamma-glutamyl-gamma-aminobutyrate hydrolase family protein [Alicyclobacillus sp. ALC3]WDL98598.1 gamma-glutamyl-gamma-aminobutyrate hydrolase family protein [Alicyclobacillus sp. ALC3]